MSYQKIRGTRDILPAEMLQTEFVKQTARRLFSSFGYKEIRTPVLEPTDLFVHSTGDTTEIVEKQMYTFTDQGNRSITLRPEGTPGVIRAIIENELPLPQKLFYIEAMFRQEKPQKGRYREFNQIGIEAVGISSPIIDAEVVAVGAGLIRAVGVQGFIVEVNSIGCKDCRPAFRDALVKFMKPKLAAFCSDCQRRAQRNPLRVYDCKNEKCQRLVAHGPTSVLHLCPDCLSHYERVKKYLGFHKLAFVENPRIVRGLDYYTRTVFEIKSSELGAQDTIIGGGRYDYLMKELGGPEAPSIGFALGLERLVLLAEKHAAAPVIPRSYFIIVMLEDALSLAINLQQNIAAHGMIAAVGEPEKGIKRQMKDADRLKADFTIIIGEDELKGGFVTLRDMKEGSQKKLILEEIEKLFSHV